MRYLLDGTCKVSSKDKFLLSPRSCPLPSIELLDGHWHSNKVALDDITAQFSQPVPDHLILYAFGDHL
ncbi:hypothetical protein D9M69_634420 [compost metagenome]